MKALRVGFLLPAILFVGSGCVMKSTYEQALADLDATKAELEQAKTQSRALEREAAELERLKVDLTRQFEAATTNLQQAKQDIENEQAAAQRQLSQLNQKLSQLAAQQNSLRVALQRAQDERPALQTTIDKFKSKLGETDGPRAPSFTTYAPVSPPVGDPQVPSPAVADQVRAVPDPAPQPAAASAPVEQSGVKTDRPRTAAAEPAEEGIFSTIKGWVLSLWHSIFS